MKKSLIAMVLLFAVSITGLGAASLALDRSGEEIEVTETTLAGDLSAARDLRLQMNVHLKDNLRWKMDLTPGQDPEATMWFTGSPPRPEWSAENCVILEGGPSTMSGSGLFTLPDPDLTEINELLIDVANRTKAGETHTETLRYGDYYDIYPLKVEIHRTEGDIGWRELAYLNLEENPQYQILSELSQAFRFSVEENHQIKTTITKDEEGNIIDLETESQDAPMLYAVSAAADQYLYFVVDARTAEGELMDYSQTPGGYGLYRLPREGVLSIEQLEMVLPLDTREKVLELSTKPGGGDLLIVANRDGEYILRVLDGASGQEKQCISIWEPDDPGHSGYRGKEVYDDFIVLYGNQDRFRVFQQVDGRYAPALSGTSANLTALLGEETWNFSGADMAFDGERLAQVYWSRYGDDQRMLRIILVVYDADGISYTGLLDNSMEQRGLLDWEDTCLYDSIQLEWAET